MTRERAKELLPVIQAWAEGKPIQGRRANDPECPWNDMSECGWLPDIEYRVKPEPREGWVLQIIETKEEAERLNADWKKSLPSLIGEIIHVREVIE